MIRVLSILVSLIVIAFSLLRLDAYVSVQQLLDKSEKQDSPLSDQDKSVLDRLSDNHFLNHRELVRLSRLYSDLGEKKVSVDERLNYICKTQEMLVRALQRDMLNARSLVAWASVRQLLQNYQCPGTAIKTAGTNLPDSKLADWENALDLAIKSAPLDQQALFNAGLILVWGKKTERAYPIFKKVLELSSDTSPNQRKIIYNLVKDSESLEKLIPARIPQILEFLRYMHESAALSKLKIQISDKLLNLELKALADFNQRYQREEIDDQLYLSRLSEFWEIERFSRAAKAADLLLYEFYSKKEARELAKFFEQRSNYSELTTLIAYKASDTRPLKSMLSEWGTQKRLSIDSFFNSTGFYLPANTTLRRIELHSATITTEPLQNLIRVFASDDNYNWEDLTGVSTVNSVIFNSRMIISIELPGSVKPFWKINFQNAARTSKFSGKADSLVRPMGIGG